MPGRPVFHPEIGQFFTDLRDSKGWTQRQAEDIAERKKLTALTRQVLWRLEKGKTKNIEPKVLRALASLYQMSYEDLVSRWTIHRYGVKISDETRDLLGHAIDQPSDPSRGSDGSASAVASHLQQQHEALLAATEDVALRLWNALEAQGRKLQIPRDDARTGKGKPGARPRPRKAG